MLRMKMNNYTPQEQLARSLKLSGLSENTGASMIAGLNKTVFWGLTIGLGLMWWMKKPKRRAIRS